jgi:hypothetical protein
MFAVRQRLSIPPRSTMRPRPGKQRTPSVFGRRLLLPCVWCDARWAGARQGSRTAAVSNAALSSLYQLGADVTFVIPPPLLRRTQLKDSLSPSPARRTPASQSSPSRTAIFLHTPSPVSCAGPPSRAYRFGSYRTTDITPPLSSTSLRIPWSFSLAFGKLDPGRFVELARSYRRLAVQGFPIVGDRTLRSGTHGMI